jgi:membrane-associated phospholipid phosphatase
MSTSSSPRSSTRRRIRSPDRPVLAAIRPSAAARLPTGVNSCGVTDYASTRNEGIFPRGWQHLALQFAIWLGFYGAYQVARGAADRGVGQAFWNGTLVIEFENRFGLLFEPAIQRLVEGSNFLISATSLTYWLSQFAIVGLTLLWVYFRHHEVFATFRNWLIGANLAGLVVYVLMPTAPPRLFPEWSFIDTLAEHSSVDQSSVAALANPYAAMPSLHATDALIVGVVMAGLCKTWPARIVWLLWPAWVSFAVMGTGNHFWLDCAVGFLLALATGFVLLRGRFPALLSRAVGR